MKIIWIFNVTFSGIVDLSGNDTPSISDSEDFHYLLVADYPGHVTTYFRTQCEMPVYLKGLICDI